LIFELDLNSAKIYRSRSLRSKFIEPKHRQTHTHTDLIALDL